MLYHISQKLFQPVGSFRAPNGLILHRMDGRICHMASSLLSIWFSMPHRLNTFILMHSMHCRIIFNFCIYTHTGEAEVNYCTANITNLTKPVGCWLFAVITDCKSELVLRPESRDAIKWLSLLPLNWDWEIGSERTG